MTGGARIDDGGARAAQTTVFVSDPTAEAERIAQALRTAGYAVVDVPLSMLIARVAVQHPRVILLDADAEGALDVVARMRELPDADAIDVLFVARPGGAVATPEQALSYEGSGLFVRPVDIPALVKKVDVLTGGSISEAPPAGSQPPPPSIPSSGKKRSSVPPGMMPSLPPASMRAPDSMVAVGSQRPVPSAGRLPSEPPTSATGAGMRRLAGLAAPVSPELQQLLADAEARAQVSNDGESIIPSPDEEIEAVLPAELLAALDEPIEEDEDEDEGPARSMLSSSGLREGTSDGGGSRTTGTPTTGVGSTGGGHTPRGVGTGAGERPATGEATLTPVPPQTHSGTNSGSTGGGPSTSTGDTRARSVAEAAAAPPPPAPVALRISQPPPTAWSPSNNPPARPPDDTSPLPTVLGEGDPLAVVARSVIARTTASLCFAASDAERRLVLRDGDLVTASSTAEEESLLAFLGARGDLPRETVRRLQTRFPPFGRHAGAALVGRGYLKQEQMWPTLRAHAEWILAATLQMAQGRLVVEAEAPGRLAGEPSVFGGSTGAEVFVDVVRRIVPPPAALERLGGLGSRLADGPAEKLLGECNLGVTESEQLRGMAGKSVREILEGAPEGDLATVIYALALLGVVEVMRAVGGEAGGVAGASEAELAAVDAEGIRERVRARRALVDDGDYFSLLGVPRNATGYEVRRAFLELRRAFDPARVLIPEVADLAEDVRQITLVLEEAYDILKDTARRERYRRAIEAVPETG